MINEKLTFPLADKPFLIVSIINSWLRYSLYRVCSRRYYGSWLGWPMSSILSHFDRCKCSKYVLCKNLSLKKTKKKKPIIVRNQRMEII